jgi:hypothetical protein
MKPKSCQKRGPLSYSRYLKKETTILLHSPVEYNHTLCCHINPYCGQKGFGIKTVIQYLLKYIVFSHIYVEGGTLLFDRLGLN